ncbi:MAG TPA: heparan-alpha-glucosaminide N-acetyltransferase domain-containing protein [Gemmatimonadales bacterium]|nr:heparan-alpha-glucosaminide N-acetyltransferase domain-containing protein [Gemmatimonadales bacterium]
MSTASATPAPPSSRIASLDIVRGAVMVLMAIDHVRVYAGVPPGGPTPGVFFTRWVTHYCAPIFIFLAGTGAYLYGRTHGGRAGVAKYLAIRGAWLVLLELTVLRVGWTFNFDFGHYLLAGVIWVIGWCMILMALLVRLPAVAVGIFGVVVIAGHNLSNLFMATLGPALQQSGARWLWQILYFGGPVQLGTDGPTLAVLYVIVPWIGVMAAGYGFGLVMELPAERRRQICLRLGAAAVVAFLLLRGFNLYGDPRPWTGNPDSPMPALLRFLNTTKYPASLLFLLMTLGPMFLVLPALEGARGRVAGALAMFGRVPFFFYVLHIPLIHVLALLVSVLRTGAVDPWLFTNHPMMNPEPPDGYTWSLGLLYLMWAVAVTMLYVACRWFAEVKRTRKDPWLAFL